MPNKVSFQDILFIDQRRLDLVAEQIAGSQTVVEKGRKLGIKFSLTGLEVSAEQPETRRLRTTLEKMHLLKTGLKKENVLIESRPIDEWHDYTFVLERCNLHKVEVPKIADGPHGTSALTFWLSPTIEKEQKTPFLCLLEDYSPSDEQAISFRPFSAYTVLQSLVHYTRGRLEETYLGHAIPNNPHPNPYACFDKKPASLVEYHNVQESCYEFITDHERLLQMWGCRVAAPRHVETLYRVREYGNDNAQTGRMSVFGYPLWIVTVA